MKAHEKKVIRDQLTQFMLQAAITLAYKNGLYPNTQDFGVSKTRAELAENKQQHLLNEIVNRFDDAFKADITKKLNALLAEMKKLNKAELENVIKDLNHAVAKGQSAQEALQILNDTDLDGIPEQVISEQDLSGQLIPKQSKEHPKHLVLSGGGIKGVAYEAVFETLENNGLLEDIDDCYGSSVGGLSAALLALGYNLDEIKQNMNVTQKMLLDTYRHESVSPFSPVAHIVKNVFNHAAIAKGYKLFELAQNAVAQKLGDPNATFADLEKRFGQVGEEGGKFRHLTVTATVKDPRRGFYQVVLNAETVPNMPIALALRMTAGLPPVFRGIELTPEELDAFRVGATKPLVQYDRGEGFPPYDPANPNDDIPVTARKRNAIKFIDGGVTDNLPIYLPLQKGAKMEEVIALNFVEPWRAKHREENKNKFSPSKIIKTADEKGWINTQVMRENDFVYYVYQRKRYAHMPAIPPQHLMKAEKVNAVINIPTEDVKAADFDLAEEKKNMLRNNGKKVTESYLRKNGVEPKEPEEPKATSSTKQLLAQHEHHQEILSRAKDFLKINFHLRTNSDYLNFKKHVDLAGKEVEVIRGQVTDNVRVAKEKFTEMYEMRNAVSDAFAKVKKETNAAQRCLYGLWDKVPFIKKIVRKVDKKLHERFEELYELNVVIKALNAGLKAQRVAGVEKGHKKYSPYKDHLRKAAETIKQPVSEKLRSLKAEVKRKNNDL